jgi:outer membrane receptor protein involved in Fe transport
VARFIPGTTVPNPTEGLRVANIPWLFGNAEIEVHRRNLLGARQETSLFYEASFTEEYFYAFEVSQHQDRKIPRSFTHTVGLEHRFYHTGLTLTAEVHNLTNENVMNQFNQPLPGRVFRVKMRYTRMGEG